MGLSKTTFSKRIFRRVYYSRYIDNFLLGIRGPKFLAIDVRDETTQFIKCNLQLELQLTEVYHAKSNKVKYLGFEIKVLNNAHHHKPIMKDTISLKKIKNKLKQKKLGVQAHEKAFLNQVLYKKITSLIKQKITHKTKPNKITRQLIQKELLNVLHSSILTSTSRSESTKLINPFKSIGNRTKKSKSYTNKLLQENTSNNSLKQSHAKKINNTSNRIIYKTLYNYRNDAGPMLYAPKKSIIKLMCN